MRKFYSKILILIIVNVFITIQYSYGQCPTITCPSDISVSNTPGTCGAVVNFTPPVGTNSCPSPATFNYTGSVQTFTVPSGVTSINFDVIGASGGTGYLPMSIGGNGGRIQGTLTVVPGQILNIYVGGFGVNGTTLSGGAGGYNGGGTGALYSGSYAGGGGGGASDIRVSPYGLANRIVVAGGGGGGAFDYSTTNSERGGDGGGTTGQTGYYNSTVGGNGYTGTGGTQVGGGLAGNYPGYCLGFNGSLGIGGNGGPCTNSGGGGGGGYYGGGGGVWAGGGGGSSYSDPILSSAIIHTQGYQTGNGQIILSWIGGNTMTSLTQGLPSGSTFPVGVTTQTYTVTDQLLNTASCSFTVTVNDTEAPNITCPSNIIVNHDAGMCGAVVSFTPPVGVDNCEAHTETFNYTGTVQSWTVPAGVTSIHIDAEGAQGGGTSNGTSGGLGAKMTGDFTVIPGSSLSIVVGQKGLEQVGGNVQNSSGGGGGTFVYTAGPTLLVAAGGGGGKCNYTGSSPLHPAADGQITTSGGASSDGNLGGTLGNGGNVGYFSGGWNDGGGGAGWLTPGGDATLGGKNAPTWLGGNPYCGGGGGGCGGYGGFGGGGGGGNDYGGGGGGGGYSGGGGGTDPTHGGGGGSYSIGTNQVNTAGFKTGDGIVIISYNLPTTTVLTTGLPSGSTFPTGTTTETYTSTDFAGNSSNCSFNITVNGIDTSVTVNQQTLTSNETGTYQWYNCNTSSIIPGATSVSYTATANGSYAVIVTENGCTDTSSCHTITTVAINEAAHNFNIDVYPNPTNSNVTIGLPQGVNPININITDISGKIVYSQFLINSKHTVLDLKQFTPGVYFMKLFNDNNSMVIKLVKF